MKLQTISHDSGFLISEAVIAFMLMTLFLSSAVVLVSSADALRNGAVNKLERLEWISENRASTTIYTASLYGNDSVEKNLEPITVVGSNYRAGWGRDTCDPRLAFNSAKISLHNPKVYLGTGNASTDIEVRHKMAYVTADSASASLPDFYILDVSDPDSPVIISSLNTGPGLSALEVAGPYIYAANFGTTHQLHVIDIRNRSSPAVVARIRLPTPEASTTAPFATSIFYSNGRVYVGTEKWVGSEFAVFDVESPAHPVYLGGFETNTQINDIYVRDGQAYIAASDIGQLRILDVSNPSALIQTSLFSPSGWETQQGKAISFFENALSLGRTVGGFNVPQNHEMFSFSTTLAMMRSRDIPGGVYDITHREYLMLATHFPDGEFQVWDGSLNQKIYEKSLGFSPRAMACDEAVLYFATGDEWGIATLKIN